jgi:GNAT superfamily N-acetyltransferase
MRGEKVNDQHHIRRAVAGDAVTVIAMVYELAAYQGEADHVAAAEGRWRELLAREDIVVLIAECADGPIGYVSALQRPHLWSGKDLLALDDLYVREAYRGTGVGRALMVALARHAAPHRHTISWSIQPDNHGAQRFYSRLGANLRPKIVASWDVEAYSVSLSD